MTLTEIIENVNNGVNVFWKTFNYKVVKNLKNNEYFIKCDNGHCIGLTMSDNVTLNGNESDFFIK